MHPAASIVLAHQGGWDELLWFGIPAAGVAAFIWWVERTARRRRAEGDGAEGSATIPGRDDT
jgi:hypothetical protein